MKIYKMLILIFILSILHTSINAAQLPEGMCAKPSMHAMGSTTDAVSYYLCSSADVPSEDKLRDSLVGMLIKANAPYIWFDINVLKDNVPRQYYHDHSSYKPYLFGFIDENNKMFIQRAYKNSDDENRRAKEYLAEEYGKVRGRVYQEALKNGTLKFETVRPQPYQSHDHTINSNMQKRIDKFGQRLRGY